MSLLLKVRYASKTRSDEATRPVRAERRLVRQPRLDLSESPRQLLLGLRAGLADVNVRHIFAHSALHGAAPLKLAVAAGDAFDTHGVVASSAAHDLAAVHASGELVALPSVCAQGAWEGKRRVKCQFMLKDLE